MDIEFNIQLNSEIMYNVRLRRYRSFHYCLSFGKHWPVTTECVLTKMVSDYNGGFHRTESVITKAVKDSRDNDNVTHGCTVAFTKALILHKFVRNERKKMWSEFFNQLNKFN